MRRVLVFFISFLGPFLLKLLSKTLRIIHRGREHLEACLARRERVIFVFWHGRMLMMPFAAPGLAVAGLISQHRDGEYISRVVERLNFLVIRGSATRGGTKAVRKMIQALREGWNLAITPDGPRGPRGKVKAGVIELGRLTGAPLFPVAFSASMRLSLKSWDAFLIPLPFSRGVYLWGEPLYVRAEAGEEEMAKLRQLLEERLHTLTMEADAYFAQRRSEVPSSKFQVPS